MRNSQEIRIWMLREGLKVSQIACDLSITSSVVSRTIRGKKNSRKVLRYLLDKGCPWQHLNLPPDVAA